MHDNNYVHFDIKLENIVITNTTDHKKNNRISNHWIFDSQMSKSRSRTMYDDLHISKESNVKLIDFSLSYEISTISSKISPGTSGYRSPELGLQKDIDYKKCDIYSRGMTFGLCLLFNKIPHVSIDDILTGRESNTLFKLLEDINLQDIVDKNPDIRPDIDTVITRLR